MANWQDRPVTFNPYVQQLPVEEMAKVGITRQQQYNEGITKIQSQIDNIAGFDIIKDIDKNYLQSKLNELGSNLKSVAAGDFSNFQLVNTVGGMTNQIAKDNNVVNALNSTAHHRKQLGIIEDARSKGELTPENEFNYQKQFNIYYNSNKVGDKFSGNYTPYFDVDKYVKETFNTLKPDNYTIDQIFQTDNQGNLIKKKVVNPKTGMVEETYELSTTMSRLKKEGMFPSKVREAINQIFTNPRVSQQLQITGEYNYQNYSPQQLEEKINITKTKQIVGYNDMIKELNIKKSIASVTDKDNIQKEIDKLNEVKAGIDNQYTDLITAAYSNPDSIRGLLHKEDVRDNYMSMYTSVNEERTIHANPAWQANFEMQKEANDNAIKKEEMSYKWSTLVQSERHFNLNLDWEKEKFGQTQGKGAGGKVPTSQGFPNDEDITKYFDDNYTKAASMFSTATDNLLFDTGVVSNTKLSEYRKQFPDKSLEEIKDVIIVEEAKKQGISPEEFRTKWYDKALTLLELNPQLLNNNPALKDVKTSAENAQKIFSEYQLYKKQIDAGSTDLMSNPLEGISPVKINFSGSDVILSPEMQLDIALASQTISANFSPAMKFKITQAKERLKNMNMQNAPQQMVMQNYGKAAQDNFRKIESRLRGDFSKITDKRAEIIKNIYQMNDILATSIITGKPEIDKQNLSYIATLASNYNNLKQNLPPEFNITNINDILQNPDEGSISLRSVKNEVTGVVQPTLIFNDATGETVGKMSISPTEASNLGYNVENWYKSGNVKLAEMKVNFTGNNSTANGDVEDFSTYRINDVIVNKNDLPNLANIPQTVKGNIKVKTSIDNAGVSKNTFFNYIYVNDDGREFLVPMPEGKPTMGEALEYFKKLTPQAIQALLSEQTKNKYGQFIR